MNLTNHPILLTNEEFIVKSNHKHNNKYIYDKLIYKGSSKKVIIKCNVHGYFEQLAKNHLRGVGCQKCARKIVGEKNSNNTENFIKRSKELFNDKYDYRNVNYINSHLKVIIYCKEHGNFLQTPKHHLNGHECPKCTNFSKGEKMILDYLDKNQIKYIHQKRFLDCLSPIGNCLRFDFYLPDFNICIEFDGRQHHTPVNIFGGIETFNKLKIYDNIKNDYCKNNKIHLIRISNKKEISNLLDKFEIKKI